MTRRDITCPICGKQSSVGTSDSTARCPVCGSAVTAFWGIGTAGKIVAYVIAAAVAAVGVGSLSTFGVFLWTGAFRLVSLQLNWYSALACDALLCLLLFVQHSGMVRKSFRAWLTKLVPVYAHGAFYTLASGCALLLLTMCWQPTDIRLVSAQGAAGWTVRALFLAGLGGFAWGIHALHKFDGFGIEAFLSHVKGQRVATMPLVVRGPYRWVRHPFYFFAIVAIWACPILTADRILFDTLCTSWIILGALLEERDLVVEFGDSYRIYQQNVPMLIPWRLPVSETIGTTVGK